MVWLKKTSSAWGSPGASEAGKMWRLCSAGRLPGGHRRVDGGFCVWGESVITCVFEGYYVLCTFACVSVTVGYVCDECECVRETV